MNNLIKYLDIVKSNLEKHKIKINLAVPFRCHQITFIEKQNLYGINKHVNFYNNSTNDQFQIDCYLKNNFYEISSINFFLKKTSVGLLGLNSEELRLVLFEGTCEEANEIFEALKKEFYDPHIKIPVPPKQ